MPSAPHDRVPSQPASGSLSQAFEQLLARRQADGGFSSSEGGKARSDATAWALIALAAGKKTWEGEESDFNFLLRHQMEDGRVVLSEKEPATIWVTPLFILALDRKEKWKESRDRAIAYLLSESGLHPKNVGAVVGHDMSIRGWPWIDNTHSWVDSTALALLALRSAGLWENERFLEAVRLIMNRQLPAGGWNYGNTTVYGVELRPTPESTSIALVALQGLKNEEILKKSVEYLRQVLLFARTPLTLGWGTLALGASTHSLQDKTKIDESLADQERVGPYVTEWLSLLILAGCFLQGSTMPWTRSEGAGV